jgi:hypothetical protein
MYNNFVFELCFVSEVLGDSRVCSGTWRLAHTLAPQFLPSDFCCFPPGVWCGSERVREWGDGSCPCPKLAALDAFGATLGRGPGNWHGGPVEQIGFNSLVSCLSTMGWKDAKCGLPIPFGHRMSPARQPTMGEGSWQPVGACMPSGWAGLQAIVRVPHGYPCTQSCDIPLLQAANWFMGGREAF